MKEMKRSQRRPAGQGGFTLIELAPWDVGWMGVVAVISILVAIGQEASYFVAGVLASFFAFRVTRIQVGTATSFARLLRTVDAERGSRSSRGWRLDLIYCAALTRSATAFKWSQSLMLARYQAPPFINVAAFKSYSQQHANTALTL